MPDFCMLVVGSNMGVQLMTREHIAIACALNIPMFVAVTKVSQDEVVHSDDDGCILYTISMTMDGDHC